MDLKSKGCPTLKLLSGWRVVVEIEILALREPPAVPRFPRSRDAPNQDEAWTRHQRLILRLTPGFAWVAVWS
jgi:hypothetical protein